jgi:hypothetical protein
MLINFEHLAADGEAVFVPNGYDGFNFENVAAADLDAVDRGLGYSNVLSSGHAVGLNAYGLPCAISADADFAFYGGNFAAAWDKHLKVIIKGFHDGELVAKHVFILDQTRTHIEIDDLNRVDRVEISTRGGVDADPNDGGSGAHVGMDDLEVRFVSHQPPFFAEPDPFMTGADLTAGWDLAV